jgi:hypothetical protein
MGPRPWMAILSFASASGPAIARVKDVALSVTESGLNAMYGIKLEGGLRPRSERFFRRELLPVVPQSLSAYNMSMPVALRSSELSYAALDIHVGKDSDFSSYLKNFDESFVNEGDIFKPLVPPS